MIARSAARAALLALVACSGSRKEQPEPDKAASARETVKTLTQCLTQYKVDIGAYPTTEEGLHALLACPPSVKDPRKWKGPYLREMVVPYDPWGNDFVYKYPGERGLSWPDIFSAGPDGSPVTADDIWAEP